MRKDLEVEQAIRVTLKNRFSKATKAFPLCRVDGVQDLGCSVRDFVRYIEGRFEPGMTWENHGPHGWHLDHIRPLASFDFDDPFEAAKAAHFSNYQPLWAGDNKRKGVRFRPSADAELTAARERITMLEARLADAEARLRRLAR